MHKPQNDVMMPRIGEEAERPRLACPDCKASPPRQLGVDDFPSTSRDGVLQAIADGADFYACIACGKRWAVVRQRMTKDENGVASLEPVRREAPPSPSRKHRRALEAHNARAIRRNLRLAARDGEPMPQIGREPPASADDRRKARNRAKADRRKGRA